MYEYFGDATGFTFGTVCCELYFDCLDWVGALDLLARDGTFAIACCVLLARILVLAELLREGLVTVFLLPFVYPPCLSAMFFTLSLPRSATVSRLSFCTGLFRDLPEYLPDLFDLPFAILRTWEAE